MEPTRYIRSHSQEDILCGDIYNERYGNHDECYKDCHDGNHKFSFWLDNEDNQDWEKHCSNNEDCKKDPDQPSKAAWREMLDERVVSLLLFCLSLEELPL